MFRHNPRANEPDKPGDGELAVRSRRAEGLLLFMWWVAAASALAFWLYTLALEAKARLGDLLGAMEVR